MRLKNVKGANEIIINGTYYVSDPFMYRGNWNKLFGNNNPIYIEIGMGKGNFIIENAKKYKNINFIGIEKFDSVIVRAIQKSNELELNNLKIVRIDAWPKDRHAKRRLTSLIFLNIYSKIFEGRNRIIMKTDNIDLFDYSLNSLLEYGYDIIYKTNDLDCLDENNIMTEYESKFYNKGIKINKFEAIMNEKSD